MQTRSRKRIYILAGIILASALFYPIAANVLIFSGALESLISRKPEKLAVQWDKAWTLIPGRVNVENLNVDIHTKKNRILIDAADAYLELSLFALLDRTLDIGFGGADGVRFSFSKRPTFAEQPENLEGGAQSAAQDNTPATTGSTDTTQAKPGKPPWTIQIKNVSATNITSIRFLALEANGNGTLKDYAMRLKTKGGPLRIDNIDLDMKVNASPEADFNDPDLNYAQLKLKMRLAENIPKQNRGAKILKFISGRAKIAGDADDIESLGSLFGNELELNVSEDSELNVLAIMESGELMPGSMFQLDSADFEADLPALHISGGGAIGSSIDQDEKAIENLNIDVSDFHLNINAGNKKNLVEVSAGEALVRLGWKPLLEKTVDITHGDIDRLTFAYQPVPKPKGQKPTSNEESQTPVSSQAPATGDTPGTAVVKENKSPWTFQVKNLSANNISSLRFGKLELKGDGRIKDYAMHMVTKGGPLSVDNIDLDMKVLASAKAGADDQAPEYARLKVKAQLGENVPKENKGAKIMRFLSGRAEMIGNAKSIEFLNPLFVEKYKLQVGGGGELDMLIIAESGELMPGSKIRFDSERFDVEFLTFHASGTGKIDAGIEQNRDVPVNIGIHVSGFRLNRQGVTNPYMEGADLDVNLSAKRIFLYKEMEDDQLFVNFPDSYVRDLVDYNRFIPKQANVEILGGEGRLRGTMHLLGDIGHINLDLTGTDVELNVSGNRIRSDIQLVTNLSDGNYGKKSYDLTGTYFRMEDTQLTTAKQETEGWWGEIKISKGDLIWTEPMDIDAQMEIKIRDTGPLLALLEDATKKKSLLDKMLNIKNLKGTVGIETNEKNIVLDPILFNGKGLEVISRLDVAPKDINGVFYVKLHGIPVNFEITNSKARFKGFGGKKKVKKQVSDHAPH